MPTKEIELILFQPYCKVAYCISLFPEHSSRTNDFVTIRKRYSVYGGLRCSPPFELRLHKVNGSHYSPRYLLQRDYDYDNKLYDV